MTSYLNRQEAGRILANHLKELYKSPIRREQLYRGQITFPLLTVAAHYKV